MVLESTWLFIGLTALLMTAFAASTQTQAARLYSQYADPIAIVAGLLGTISWAMLAWGSLDVRVAAGGVTYSFTMPAVTIWCLAMAMVPLYVAVTGPLEVFKRAENTSPEDI